ncbi:MAG: dipeptidase [Planctomycetota bacterium]|nr:MAG: dipeptidase [Planctomycetota bacterium]
METILSQFNKLKEEFLKDLIEFIAIPTISTNPEYQDKMKEGAQFLVKKIKSLGGQAQIEETGGHPIVYGEFITNPKSPTILIYGHYDVQPPDPMEEWISPPFEGTVRDGKLFARGATDDKGQLWIHLAAIEAFQRANQPLPINLKLILEGEEECGSTHLIPYFQSHKEKLQAHAMIISDTPFLAKGVPTITTGLRGLIYYEIEVKAVDKDLHSGSFGGAVDNPIHGLSRMIASLHDEKGRIHIPHLYDKVRPLSQEEKESLEKLPFSEEEFQKSIGAKQLWGEEGYSILERISTRPSLDVNGIWGGYTGPGAKTVIPKKASAKLSIRLVPDQAPKEIARLLEEHLQSILPSTLELTIKPLETSIYPYSADTSHPYFQKAKEALSQAFHTDQVVFARQGGSIPFVPIVAKTLSIPCMLLGFGLPDEGAHSPNEWLDLENFYGGIETMIRFYSSLGE